MADGTADKQSAAKSDAAPSGDQRAPAPTGAGRVLVVEDSLTTAAVVKYYLQLDGFDVFVARDGLAGLAMAIHARPDIIVTDVNMPGMDGVALVKALRADARTSQIRIMMLTSEASAQGVAVGLAAGADDYVVKPVEPQRLAARVKALRARSHPVV